MKKSKSIKVQDIPNSISNEKSLSSELEKKLLYKRKNSKRDEYKKNLATKANTTITDSSKEEKKEVIVKKKISKEIKTKKLNTKDKDKEKNKTIEIPSTLSQKKSKKVIKKIKISSKSNKKRKVKNSLSQQNFAKLKCGNSTKLNLTKNKTSNNPSLSSYRADSTNNLLLNSDNFIKSLLSKYLDGTDNIINEDLEPFNCFGGDEDYEHLSFFGENNNESNTIRESLKLNKKYQLSDDIKKENNLTINNQNINSSKIKKKVMNLKKKDNNQIKTNFYSSFMNSPNRMSEGRLSMRSQTRFTTLNKKITDNIPKKRNSLKNIKKIQKDGKIDDNKESKLKRKIIYSNKIISSLNRSKPISNKNSEINEQGKKVLIPTSSNNLNLDIIFENNKILKNDQISHHYLAQTVSAKNKMVQKKINSFEDSKNTLKSCNKISTICIDTDNNNNNNLFRKTIFRLNRTPKIKKDFKTKDRYSFNNSINNFSTRNNIRKYSFRLNREISSEFNISGMSTMINSKIFNGKIDDYLITKELGKGSYAVVKLATHKLTKNKYAIKIYSKQSLIDPQKRNTVKNEVNILKQIDNENVMKLYDVIDTPSNLYLVLEYINGINLLEIIKNEKYHFLKEERAKKIFLQVVKGISYCHKKNIFHRDIKLENILVLKDDTIKIIDFGFGIKCNKDTYQKLFCGTPSYMPPEIVKKEKYIACYSDIWSLGVLFYAMLFGIFPFKGKDDDELFEKIIEAKLSFPEYNQIGDKIKELFNKIFVINPIRRISLDDMINILQE